MLFGLGQIRGFFNLGYKWLGKRVALCRRKPKTRGSFRRLVSLGGLAVGKLFGGIRAKLILLFMFIGPLPVLGSGLFTVWQSEQGLIEVEKNRILTVGTDNRNVLESWLNDQLQLLAQLSEHPSAKELDQGLLLPILELDESRRAAFDSIYAYSTEGIAQFGVDFSRGSGRLVRTREAGGLMVGDETWFQQAMTGQVATNAPYLRAPLRGMDEKYALDIGVPIWNDREVVGVLGGTIWLDWVFERVVQVGLDQHAETYLVDREGVPLMNVPSAPRTQSPLATLAAVRLTRGETGVDTYENPQGDSVVGSYVYLPAFDWGLIVEFDEDRALQSARGLAAHLRGAILYFGIGTAAAVIVVGVVASGTITKPVFAFARATRRVARGDLSVPQLPVERTDELGDIARDFTQMVHDLRRAIGDVMEMNVKLNESRKELEMSAEQSNTAADEITTTINQVASGTSSQTEAIHQTAESVETWQRSVQRIAEGAQEQTEKVLQTNSLIERMAETLQNVALQARQVAVAAERDVAAAHAGGDAVRNTVEGMEQIRQSVSDAAERVRELGEHSQKIGEIIGIIEEIAEHTNLLALNAAIEAARAGEHGRGFAVVAQEVRNLAENSARSTQQITELIASMHAGMETAIAATTLGLEQVEKGSQLAASAGNALEQIIDGINESHQMAHEISEIAGQISDESAQVVRNVNEVAAITREHTELTEGMTSAADQVVRAVTEISTISEQTAASAQEVAASAAQGSAAAQEVQEAAVKLGQYAAALDELIGRFNL